MIGQLWPYGLRFSRDTTWLCILSGILSLDIVINTRYLLKLIAMLHTVYGL